INQRLNACANKVGCFTHGNPGYAQSTIHNDQKQKWNRNIGRETSCQQATRPRTDCAACCNSIGPFTRIAARYAHRGCPCSQYRYLPHSRCSEDCIQHLQGSLCQYPWLVVLIWDLKVDMAV